MAKQSTTRSSRSGLRVTLFNSVSQHPSFTSVASGLIAVISIVGQVLHAVITAIPSV